MSPRSRSLPEDSVVASLSEIQAILQTQETPARKVPPQGQPPGKDAKPGTGQSRPVGAPVPSAAEIRAEREARWQSEMPEVGGQAPAKGAMPAWTTWALGALFLVGGVTAGVLWPRPATTEVEAPVAAPVPLTTPVDRPVAVAPRSPATTPIAETAPSSAAPAVAEATPADKVLSRQRARARAIASTSRPRGQKADTDALFGPRVGSTMKPAAAQKVKRKRTKADHQLDSVLDSL